MTDYKTHSIALVASFVLLSSCAGGTYVDTASTEAVDSTTTKNVILMVSDGIGFNGWLAADY